MTEVYDVEASSTRLRALASQLLQKSYVSERVESDSMMEYCMSGEVQGGSSSDFATITEAKFRVLLSRTRGDQLLEYCLEAKLSLNEVILPVATPTTRIKAMGSHKKYSRLKQRKRKLSQFKGRKNCSQQSYFEESSY